MQTIPEDLTALISDLEAFLLSGLKGENLSKKAKEKRDVFIKRIKEIRASYPQDFKDKRETEESDEFDEADSTNDGGSLNSERTDKDEEAAYDGAQQSPPVAAQDLPSVFKAGYLEKRRKDHSFFGTEWQKRWCALSKRTFYYYGSEKDKQQKGEFCIDGYAVKMNNTLRKDAKKDCCFEISAPDKRVYQFCAASQKEAEEWVEQINGVSDIIPEEDEHLTYDDVGNTSETNLPLVREADIDDGDIYEELPGEVQTLNKSTDYKNYYQGKWDCTGDHPDELSFKRGDTIYILSKEYQNFGWWVGEMKGSIGIVPKDYLMELYAI
uniref:Src kinase-associated phosphoprotein 2 n=1 Tax=Scleropages formosus TaxID=113540 RepID=A0A8C9SG70_SCLFO